MDTLGQANRYLETQAPWKTAKTDLVAAGESLAVVVETLRVCCILLYPVMPTKMTEALKLLGQKDLPTIQQAKWGMLATGTPVEKALPLFPRIEVT
jgi:methionyl-tRNA synthetase